MKIEDLGYNSFFEESRKKLELCGFPVARVISEFKEAYRVKNADGEYFAKVTGKQIFKATSREDYPAVGDWVAIETVDDDHAVILGILHRRTVLKRKYRDRTQVIAANIDTAFVIESIDRDYNLNRFERYFAIAENGGVKPAIILNKVDLLSEEESDEKMRQLKKRFPDTDIIFTSAVGNKGFDELKKYILKNHTYCFLGSSGVGKSTLINRLLNENAIKTGGISSYSGRGKHVTTNRQMYFLPAYRNPSHAEANGETQVGADGENGGIVIDNPGMRQVGMADAGSGIDSSFDEIAALSEGCQYTDCTHTHEPGCEVLKAVESGKLDKEKYSNYLNLKKEAEFYEMNDLEKREKDRRFGKFIKKAMKELNKFERKNHD